MKIRIVKFKRHNGDWFRQINIMLLGKIIRLSYEPRLRFYIQNYPSAFNMGILYFGFTYVHSDCLGI